MRLVRYINRAFSVANQPSNLHTTKNTLSYPNTGTMSKDIADSWSVCDKDFKQLCEALEGKDDSDLQSLRTAVLDERGRFNVWAGNIGAAQSGSSSLDYRVRDTGSIRDTVINSLECLSKTLKDSMICPQWCIVVISDSSSATSIVDGTRLPWDRTPLSPDTDSDSSEDGEIPTSMPSETELQQLKESMLKTVANLFKMSVMIRKRNVSQDRLLRCSNISVSHYEPFDVQHAKSKFPAAEVSLITHLGRAITRRRQFLEYQKQNHEKLAYPYQVDLPASYDQEHKSLQATESESLVGTQNVKEPIDLESSVLRSATVEGSTAASTFLASNLQESVNLNVDAYSETETTSSYQTSLVGDEKLQLPPIPRESLDGQNFECPYCYTICRLSGTTEEKRQKQWKRHIFKDLQPYVCTFTDCMNSVVMFEKRADWFRHERRNHRREWCCNASDHDAHQDKESFKKHMSEQHEVTQAQLSSVLALCERPLETTPSSCRLCDSKGLSPEQLETHLARHMEALALFALPKTYDRREDESDDSKFAA